jgi:hypothetical protein
MNVGIKLQYFDWLQIYTNQVAWDSLQQPVLHKHKHTHMVSNYTHWYQIIHLGIKLHNTNTKKYAICKTRKDQQRVIFDILKFEVKTLKYWQKNKQTKNKRKKNTTPKHPRKIVYYFYVKYL